MNARTTQSRHTTLDHSHVSAEANRKRILDAGVFALTIVGGPGCGKTTLINRSIQEFGAEVRSQVVTCVSGAAADAERALAHDHAVIFINVGGQQQPTPCAICDGLDQLDLMTTDLLLIENVGTLSAMPTPVGQEANVVIFSVASGHDQPAKHPGLTRSADAVVLNKTDLLPFVPFDLDHFRRVVHELNPHARIVEVSALNGTGFQEWLTWLRPRRTKAKSGNASHWFG